MDFIDMNNEWSAIYNNYKFKGPDTRTFILKTAK